jgi:hypothetical protein
MLSQYRLSFQARGIKSELITTNHHTYNIERRHFHIYYTNMTEQEKLVVHVFVIPTGTTHQ